MLLLYPPHLVDSPGRVPSDLGSFVGYGAKEAAEDLHVPITVPVLAPAPLVELTQEVVPKVGRSEEEHDQEVEGDVGQAVSYAEEGEEVLIVFQGFIDFIPRVQFFKQLAHILEVLLSLIFILADYVLVDDASYVQRLECESEPQVNVKPCVVCVR